MIKEFIDRFEANKHTLRTTFAEAHPDSYKEIVQGVVRCIQGESEYYEPSPDRIHEIDDGDYQGTLVYVIAAGGYQPDDYWYVKVGYGSCSGCDTLQAISGYSDEKPTDSQIEQYMTLATHILQGLKKMGEDNQTGPY
jgi:hypothetical protein